MIAESIYSHSSIGSRHH